MLKTFPLLLACLLLFGCAHGTALHRAAKKGDLDAAEKALLNGIQANARDSHGDTPLHYAATRDYSKIIPNFDVTDIQAATALLGGFREMMLLDLLIRNGAEVDAVNDQGRTPLHTAAVHNSPQVGLFLLMHGADPQARDKIGRTPAELALQHGSGELEKILGRLETLQDVKQLQLQPIPQ